ncbi:hypothetical protein ACLMJK_001737 [Lecanora helva]
MTFHILLPFFLAVTGCTYAASDMGDIASSGNYLIHLCNANQANSHASYLQQILDQIYTNVQAVIADAHLGTASKRGFGAFFKTDENIDEVIRVFEHIAAGTDIMIESIPGRGLPSHLPAKPTLVCINDIPETASVYHNCVVDFPGTPLVHWEESDLIALCPDFWKEEKVAVARTDCPKLRGSNLSPNTDKLSRNQEAMIVHELVHIYQNVTQYPDEVMNIQDAINLNATSSFSNANNYALYYAAVQAGCTRWPALSQSRESAHLHLVGSSNAPMLLGDDSASKTLNSVEYPAATDNADPFPLEIRQDSCMSWTQAPNSSVCCDPSSGQWVETDIQRDDYVAGGPTCVTQVGSVNSDGSSSYSNVAPPKAATTPASLVHEDYCNGAMQLPNSTVCCDMSTGLWIPAAVIRDTPATNLVSAACPTPKPGNGGPGTGSGWINY